jgi:ribonuclease R
MKKTVVQDIIDFLKSDNKPVTKNQLLKALNIPSSEKKEFTKTINDLVSQGILEKKSGSFILANTIPNVLILEISNISSDGTITGTPVDTKFLNHEGLQIAINKKPKNIDLLKGHRVLARIHNMNGVYKADIIRTLDKPKNRIIGQVHKDNNNFLLLPTDKKAKTRYSIPEKDLNGAIAGQLVEVEIQPSKNRYRKNVRVIKTLSKTNKIGSFSEIAIREAGLRDQFSETLINETKNLTVPNLDGRDDLRLVPLVTIDGIDAKDFDDAVWGKKTNDGAELIIAIADVSYYVRPGSELDNEAYLRGNSTYFPDKVIPMLPEKLSNDLCSLRPDEDRACIYARIKIDQKGQIKSYEFKRGLMKSFARLTYEQVQRAKDGSTDKVTASLMKEVIEPLYSVYEILKKARDKRNAMELDLPERKIVVNKDNEMVGITQRVRLDSHKLIEEFMILANVAAALALEEKEARLPYRVHEKPDSFRMESAKNFIRTFGIQLPEGSISSTKQINSILTQIKDHDHSDLIQETLLRAQSQAHYSPHNKGHFGLALQSYAHFTSPIRRYSDLLLHRSLVSAFKLGPGGLNQEQEAQLEEKCNHISATERVSAEAERNALDRFAAEYLSNHIGPYRRRV